MKKLLALLLIVSASTFAYEVSFWDNHPIQINGSFSIGYMKTTDNNVLTVETEDGSQINEQLLNFSVPLTERLTLGAQLISRDFGRYGENDILLDWGYLDYSFNEAVGLRVGRVKLGLGIQGDLWDIDVGRPNISLPWSTYPSNIRDLYSFADGAQIYGNLDVGEAGSISYQFFYGTQQLPKKGTAPSIFINNDNPWEVSKAWDADRLFGGKITWQTPVAGLKLSVSGMHIKIYKILKIYF